MSRNLRGRLSRLEKRQPGGQISIWDVICGAADPDDLDEAGQETLREMCNPPGPPPTHPLVQMLRREWARLGIPNPGSTAASTWLKKCSA